MIIQKSDFISIIKPLKAAISSKLTGNTEGVLVRDNRIYADNHEYTIAAEFKCSEKPFVLPKRAIELIESMPEGQIKIEPGEKDVLIKSDAGNGRFSTVPADAFYISNPLSVNKAETCAFSASTLCDLLSRVIYACAHDNSVHSGVLIEADGEELHLAAMDGYRLAIAHTKQNSTFKAILPATAAAKLISLGITGNISIQATKNEICISTEGYTIATKLLAGNFVDYRAAVPKAHTATLEIDRGELADVITRSLICSYSGTEKAPIKLEYNSGMLKIRSISTVAAYEAEIAARLIDGTEEIKISLNGKYLLDALKSYAEEKVTLEYNGTLKPLVVNGAMLTSIVMPVRIK